ncbi:right-handed parallel beta-helix repeat-containing protein [Flavobacteriaceae bacterium]|nr:right-handed parallel beta-helix repeat-containing protein [Flavobacteriaceae bacterium]
MEDDLDMNTNRITNLPSPVNDTDAVRWVDVKDGVTGVNEVVPSQSGNEKVALTTNGTSLVFGAVDSDNVDFLQAGTGAVATDVQSKLRETVSVKDFGAVGDGVTDDTAAIQAAIASGSFVNFIADETYVVNEVIFTKDNLTLEGNGCTLLSLTQRVVGGYEVPFIGMLGGNNITIRNFTFRMNTPSTTYSGYAIENKLSNANTPIKGADGSDYPSVETASGNINILNNRFIGIGNYSFVASGGHHYNIRYEGNYSEGCIRGVGLGYSGSGSGDKVMFKNNIFHYLELNGVQSTPVPTALKVDGFYSNVVVDGNIVSCTNTNSSLLGLYAFHFECGISRSSITNNKIGGAGMPSGVALSVGQVDSTNNKQAPCSDIIIANNIIEAGGVGIISEMVNGLSITGNTIKHYASGIALTTIDTTVSPFNGADALWFRTNYNSSRFHDEAVIDNNILQYTNTLGGVSTHVGIGAQSVKNLTISDNRIHDSYTAISAKDDLTLGLSNINVSNNNIDTYAYGIISDIPDRLTVNSNQIKVDTQRPINITAACQYLTISNNTMYSGNILNIENAQGFNITGNIIRGSSTAIALNNSNYGVLTGNVSNGSTFSYTEPQITDANNRLNCILPAL